MCNHWLHVIGLAVTLKQGVIMTTTTPSSATLPLAPAADDYTYTMCVDVPLPQILAAVTDDLVIRAWWTAATGSIRHGDNVRLLMGGDDTLLVGFTVEHPGAAEVAWHVSDCVVEDWVGTRPTFTLRPNDGGTTVVEFRHVGLRPALECFDMCRAGWNHFMPSLHQFLETGVGRPNEPRDPSA